MERELTHRKRVNWAITLAVLALSILIAGIGVAGQIDLNAMLGEWRTGVVVTVGAALLFSYTILLQYRVQGRDRLESDYAPALKDSYSSENAERKKFPLLLI